MSRMQTPVHDDRTCRIFGDGAVGGQRTVPVGSCRWRSLGQRCIRRQSCSRGRFTSNPLSRDESYLRDVHGNFDFGRSVCKRYRNFCPAERWGYRMGLQRCIDTFRPQHSWKSIVRQQGRTLGDGCSNHMPYSRLWLDGMDLLGFGASRMSIDINS